MKSCLCDVVGFENNEARYIRILHEKWMFWDVGEVDKLNQIIIYHCPLRIFGNHGLVLLRSMLWGL